MSSNNVINLEKESSFQNENQSNEQKQVTTLQLRVSQTSKNQKKCRKVGVIKKQVQVDFIPHLLRENHIFYLNGDFIINIQPKNYNNCYNLGLSQVETYNRYVQLNLLTHQTEKQFDYPIQLLESSQSYEKYIFAQQLKQFNDLQINFSKQIQHIKESYLHNQEYLQTMNYERQKYRKQLINNYIKQYLNEDDFYTIAEKGQNFEYSQLEIKSLTISKPLFSLIGVDEKDINQYLLHIGLSDQVFLREQEKFYGAVLHQFTNNERNKYIFHKDFLIITLDNIKLYSDVYLQILDINYPEHLKYQSTHINDYVELDNIIIFKYNIQFFHLQQVINQRNLNKYEEDQYQNSHSLEYSLLSSIFLDKYYPNSKSNFFTENKTQNKECGYKLIY